MLGKILRLFTKEHGVQPVDKNTNQTHLKEYLDYYQTLDDPGYGVLITGAWGTGKTYQIKRCVPEDKRYYVSLFGIQSIDQLHAEVYAAAFPTFSASEKVLKDVVEGIKKIGGAFTLAGLVPSVFTSLLRRNLSPDRTLIFDDLERSRIELKDVLGAINFYIEQKGFRVIVIAHDNEVKDEFKKMKEKTFGQVLQVVPDVDNAFESFLERNPNTQYKHFVREHQQTILEVFSQSEEKSLRILKHTVEDLGRVYSGLANHHTSHKKAMCEMVSLFSALDIEVRRGFLIAEDLKDRQGQIFASAVRSSAKKDEGKNSNLITAQEKYLTIDLSAGLLSDDLLISMLFNGCYDPFQIRDSLENSPFFFKPAESPPWKVVSGFDNLEDNIVEDAHKKMNKQFENREIVEPGEMLHIFALRMMLAENGIGVRSLENEADECLCYIEDLLRGGRLPPRDTTDWRPGGSFEHSSDGYGYWVTDKTRPYFKSIFDYLIEAREKSLQQKLPTIAEELLGLVSTDAKALYEKISPTNNGENPYAYVPILHLISPENFVETWVTAPRDQWKYINYALNNRYKNNRLKLELGMERSWALRVCTLMIEKSKKESGFRSLRIRRAIPKVLLELINSEATSAS